MNPTRLVRARKVWLLLLLAALLGVLSLAACGTSSRGATPTATPDANAILQQAANADYTDVTFNLTLTTTASGQTINGTGSGAITKSPARAQLTLTIPITANGQTTQIKVETVADSATKTLYTHTTTNGIVGRWTKSSLSNGSSSGTSVDVNSLTSVAAYANAKVIGSETLDGVAVWHLQANPGTAPAATATAVATIATTKTATPTKTPTKTPTVSAASATKTAAAGATQTAIANATTVDIFIRKDNSRPVKISSHVAITGANTDVVLTFTQYNSGVTITLPKV
jgi:hypothetical protein